MSFENDNRGDVIHNGFRFVTCFKSALFPKPRRLALPNKEAATRSHGGTFRVDGYITLHLHILMRLLRPWEVVMVLPEPRLGKQPPPPPPPPPPEVLASSRRRTRMRLCQRARQESSRQGHSYVNTSGSELPRRSCLWHDDASAAPMSTGIPHTWRHPPKFSQLPSSASAPPCGPSQGTSI
jgi:hypothetical protein